MKTMMSESMKKEFGRAMRGIALVGVIAGACPPGAWAQQAEAPGALERRVDAAFEAAFPLYEMARARFNAMVNPLNPAPSPVNGTPVNRRNLIDHTARDVTTPNNDTLYSATWLDLHATPVRIRVPRVEGGRYWSVALLDIFTNNFAILGRQQDGEGPVEVTVVGPQWAGPLPGGRVIRSPSNDVQLVGWPGAALHGGSLRVGEAGRGRARTPATGQPGHRRVQWRDYRAFALKRNGKEAPAMNYKIYLLQ